MRNRTWTWPAMMAAAGLAALTARIDAQTDGEPGSEKPAASNAAASADAPKPDAAKPDAPVPPPVAEADAKAPKLSTAQAAMLRSRSPRTLMRNGVDYIKYQQFEKALMYLREAERRQNELNPTEKANLRQAIETAQQGLRTPSLQSGYARNRRPQSGSIAIAARGSAASKTDSAVARTEAALPSSPATAETENAPDGSRMKPAAKASADYDSLGPLNPDILARKLPTAAELAESSSSRVALKEYRAAGLPANVPRQPMELPKPLNDKIDSLEESESQFQASESRPDPAPQAIAASLAAQRRSGTPEPLPGSPSREPASDDAPKMDPAPVKADLTEPSPEAEVADRPLPVFEKPAAPVVATPNLPKLESTESSEPTPKAAVDEPKSAPADDLPKLPEPSDATADLPPLPTTAPKTPAPAEKAKNAEPPMPEGLGQSQHAAGEPLTEPAPPQAIASESLLTAEAPATSKPQPDRDSKLTKAQDLTAPADLSTEGPAAMPRAEPRDDAAQPAVDLRAASTPKSETADKPELPPLPDSPVRELQPLPDSQPPVAVEPIAEAADTSSDLPPLPDRPVTDRREALPPLPTAPAEPTEPAATEEPAKADLPPLPATAAKPESLPPLPTAAIKEESAPEPLPPLPTSPAEPAAKEESAKADLPPLPDTPPAPTPAAKSDEPAANPTEQPARVAQAAPGEARTPAAADALPPLPAEDIAGSPRAAAPAPEAPSESSSFSRRFLSGLNDRQRREIEELARMQQERTGGTTPGLSPLEAPAREAGEKPRIPLPAGNTANFGAIDDPLVRLELPRAPSPAEARPIRAILLPEQFDDLKPREYEPRRKMWASAATAHYPLYFQDPSLERYGISVEQRMGRAGRKLTYPIDDPKESKLRNQIATPFFSSGLFALQIATWPFRAIADPPWESTYDLGYYRPGDLVPEDTVVIPWKGVGPLFRGNGY